VIIEIHVLVVNYILKGYCL